MDVACSAKQVIKHRLRKLNRSLPQPCHLGASITLVSHPNSVISTRASRSCRCDAQRRDLQCRPYQLKRLASHRLRFLDRALNREQSRRRRRARLLHQRVRNHRRAIQTTRLANDSLRLSPWLRKIPQTRRTRKHDASVFAQVRVRRHPNRRNSIP